MGSRNHTDGCSVIDAGVPRLGIPPMVMLVEINSGVSSSCYVDQSTNQTRCPTIFPSPLNLAATFNRTVWRAKGDVVGTEARALNNLNVSRIYSADAKVDLFGYGPDINLIIDPRNGRNGELPSEDRFLTGEYAFEYLSGIARDVGEHINAGKPLPIGEPIEEQPAAGKQYLRLAAGLKHFSFYQYETDRFGAIGTITAFDAWDSFLPPYARGFNATNAAMCSYTSIKGLGPSCASPYLAKVVRNYWEVPDAVIISDCGAISSMTHPPPHGNGYAGSLPEAVAYGITNGTDINAGYPYGANDDPKFPSGIEQAVSAGLLTEADVDASLARNLMQRMRLGLFDPLEEQPMTRLGPEHIHSREHEEAAEQGAAQGIVLLKNDGGALPLVTPAVSKVAVIGPHSVSRRGLLGDFYSDAFCPGVSNRSSRADGCVPTIGDSIRSELAVGGVTSEFMASGIEVRVEEGCDVDSNVTSGIPAAVSAASWADVVVLAVGYDNKHIEHEGSDHPNVTLPGEQQLLFEEVVKAARAAGGKVVTVLINAGAIGQESVYTDSDAVVEAFYPSFGAPALAALLSGRLNSWGRLPYTIYSPSFAARTEVTGLEVAEQGRTYRYAKPSDVIYPFGSGLAYGSNAVDCTLNLPDSGTFATGPMPNATGFSYSGAAPAPEQVLGTVRCSVKAGSVQLEANVPSPDEILLAYHVPSDSLADAIRAGAWGERAPSHPVPSKSLFAFERTSTGAEVTMSVRAIDLGLTGARGETILYPGHHRVQVSPREPHAPFEFSIEVQG